MLIEAKERMMKLDLHCISGAATYEKLGGCVHLPPQPACMLPDQYATIPGMDQNISWPVSSFGGEQQSVVYSDATLQRPNLQ